MNKNRAKVPEVMFWGRFLTYFILLLNFLLTNSLLTHHVDDNNNKINLVLLLFV